MPQLFDIFFQVHFSKEIFIYVRSYKIKHLFIAYNFF